MFFLRTFIFFEVVSLWSPLHLRPSCTIITCEFDMKRVGFKEWKYKVDNYDRQRALMTGFINRMMKSYLQKGWVTWEYYDKGAVAFRAKRRTIYLQKTLRRAAFSLKSPPQINFL